MRTWRRLCSSISALREDGVFGAPQNFDHAEELYDWTGIELAHRRPIAATRSTREPLKFRLIDLIETRDFLGAEIAHRYPDCAAHARLPNADLRNSCNREFPASKMSFDNHRISGWSLHGASPMSSSSSAGGIPRSLAPAGALELHSLLSRGSFIAHSRAGCLCHIV